MADDGLFRLPLTVTPTHYELVLRVADMESGKFGGEVTIDLTVSGAVDGIHLNAVGLDMTSVLLQSKAGGIARAPSATTAYGKSQTVFFAYDGGVAVGDYTLTIVYTGELGDSMKGLCVGRAPHPPLRLTPIPTVFYIPRIRVRRGPASYRSFHV